MKGLRIAVLTVTLLVLSVFGLGTIASADPLTDGAVQVDLAAVDTTMASIRGNVSLVLEEDEVLGELLHVFVRASGLAPGADYAFWIGDILIVWTTADVEGNISFEAVGLSSFGTLQGLSVMVFDGRGLLALLGTTDAAVEVAGSAAGETASGLESSPLVTMCDTDGSCAVIASSVLESAGFAVASVEPESEIAGIAGAQPLFIQVCDLIYGGCILVPGMLEGVAASADTTQMEVGQVAVVPEATLAQGEIAGAPEQPAMAPPMVTPSPY